MIIHDKKLGGETQKTYLRGPSLISTNIPFVGITALPKRPCIRETLPLVVIRRILGFTLVELMVTVAVVAILMAIAVPNMRSVIQNTRISNQINELTSDLNFVRSEAIKRGTDTTVSSVTVCKSDNPTAATPTCNTTALGWDMGRIIFIDGTPAVGVAAAIAPGALVGNRLVHTAFAERVRHFGEVVVWPGTEAEVVRHLRRRVRGEKRARLGPEGGLDGRIAKIHGAWERRRWCSSGSPAVRRSSIAASGTGRADNRTAAVRLRAARVGTSAPRAFH